MGCGIAKFHDAVAVPRQNLARRGQQNGADRHFAAPTRRLGFGQRECYGFLVIHHRFPHWPTIARQKGERIAKMIARAGICSRRDAEKLIAAGRVLLDGEKVASPALNVTKNQVISVDGQALSEPDQARLWRYHKPSGMVTTHRDPQGRPTVFANLPKTLPRVVSVGRLDFNSEGLLLLTNDGDLARRLELPAAGWTRKYRARLFGKGDPGRTRQAGGGRDDRRGQIWADRRRSGTFQR